MVACGAARYAGRVYVALQPGHASEAEVAQARMIIGSAPQRPVLLSVMLLYR